MNLFDYDRALDDVFALAVDEETGEIVNEQLLQRLDELEMEREQKILNIAHYIQNTESNLTEIKAQKEKFSAWEKSEKSKLENLKNYLGGYLGGQKWDAPDKSVKISFRKSDQVEVVDEDSIPMNFIKTKVETSIDKAGIKKAIKEGVNVPGAVIVGKSNIQIK